MRVPGIAAVFLIVSHGVIASAIAAEALKTDIRQTYPASDSSPPPFNNAKDRSRDYSCFVSAADAIHLYRSGWMVVDLRPPAAFGQFRIAGSVQVSSYALSRSSYLKSRKIILVDEGLDYFQLAYLCSELKESGFKSVAVLFGGVAQWQQAGGAFEGSVPNHLALASISPEAFYRIRQADGLNVIHVYKGSPVEAGVMPPEPYKAVRWKRLGDEIGSKQPVSAKKPPGRQMFVLIDRDGSSYAKHLDIVMKSRVPVFFVAGGMRALRKYEAERQLMITRALFPQERRTTCGY